MVQTYNRKDALALFNGREKSFVKFGYRMVIFFDEIPHDKLHILQKKDGSPILDWSGAAIEGRGVLFNNQTDDCLQALKLAGKMKAFGKDIYIQEKNCLIINLGDNFKKASKTKGKIIEFLPEKFSNADDIATFINILQKSGITDIYCSSEKWFIENTKCIEGEPNKIGANFVEARANPVDAIYIPGEVSFNSGVTASPQSYKEGAIFIRQKNKDGEINCHGCHPKEFLHLYRIKDSEGLHSFDLSIFDSYASPGPAEVATLGMDGEASANAFDLADN